MSWPWSTSPIDELVDRATSENLPAGAEDLALNLEICDQIRSKQVLPKDAVKALKRRLGHKNPNVQLLALGLTDVCAKNGGHHFLVEVASREFIDNLTSILKAPSGCNLEVKNRILGLIQTWGILFRGKQGLGYVCDTYMILQHEGFQFPPKDNIGAALVESEAPPDWTDSDVCTRCRSPFTLTNRKHHCRACGSTFCGQCSSKTMALPNLGVTQEVRVCDGCWMKKKLGNKSAVALQSHGLGGGLEFVPSGGVGGSSNNKSASAWTPSSNGAKTTIPANATSNNNASKSTAEAEDAELLKAIELSLKEANNQSGYSAPKRSSSVPVKKAPAPAAAEEEEDADLLAAIEASLRETTIHQSIGTSPSAQRSSSQRQSSYSSYTFTKKPVTATVSPNELTDTEKANIEMFSVLVDRIQMMQGDVAGNREVQALYEQISKLQMKLALSIEEAARKQQEFVTFNEKIDHAVRIYDHLLQERLNSSYQRRMNANNYGHPGQGQYINNIPQTPQMPQQGHVYPQAVNAPDSRYAQYVSSVGPALYGNVHTQQQQTPQIPFQAPYQPQPQQQQQPQPQQSPYQYQQPQLQQPSSAPGPVPYTITSPGSVAQDQLPQQPQGFATAASTQGQYGYQVHQQNSAQQQPVQQQQLNGMAPSAMSPIPMHGQVQGQPSVLNNTYQPTMQSPPPSQLQPQQQQLSAVLGPAVQHAPYVFDPHQQQSIQQQPIQQQPIQQQPIQQQPIQQQPIQQQPIQQQPIQQQPIQQQPIQQQQILQQFSGGQQQYTPPQQQQPIQQQAYIAQPPQPIVEESPLIEL